MHFIELLARNISSYFVFLPVKVAPHHFPGLLWKVYCNMQSQFAIGKIM